MATLVDANVILDILTQDPVWFDWSADASPLPDFFIGAHAAVDGLHLLTRDSARYRRYFPKLQITAP